MRKDERAKRCRMMVFERDALVRDQCARLADSFDCDLYSSAYIENFETIVRSFQPTSIVIDLGLFEGRDNEPLRRIARHLPFVSVLFLAGEDAEFAASAEDFAWSIGLRVEAVLQRPVSDTLLEQSLRGTC